MTEHNQPISIFQDGPPSWLPEAHTTTKLGYVGFDPLRSGEDEESMSRSNVKEGYMLPPFLAEPHSAQKMILTTESAMHDVEALLDRVLRQRAEEASSVPPSTFRLPPRVTLTDAKRSAWFADLARADVPLRRLSKAVPHGAKGPELLDLLHTHGVPTSRALWLLRVFGANETIASRNKPGYDPSAYSVEWTQVVTSHLKRQLTELALPTTSKLGLHIKSTFKGVLFDSDSRTRWVLRLSYFLDLLRLSYDEGLVDRRTFLLWIAQQLISANLAQIPFLVNLAHEYLEDILPTRALAHLLASASIVRLAEVKLQAMRELGFLDEGLSTLLRRICTSLPDALMSPRLWFEHHQLMLDVFTSQNEGDYDEVRLVWEILNAAEVDERVQNLLFLNEPSMERTSLSIAVATMHTLNALRIEEDWSILERAVLDHNSADGFMLHVHAMLSWATDISQFGLHRPYVVVRILASWLANGNQSQWILHDILFDWLDTSPQACADGNAFAVSGLFGQLVRGGFFDYPAYIQRLVVRDERGLSFSSEGLPSKHRRFLRDISLVGAPSAVHTQRKMTLYGLRARDVPEEVAERAIREELQHFVESAPDGVIDLDLLRDTCPALFTARPYEQNRALKLWLVPILLKNIETGQIILNVLVACYLLLEHFECMESIFNLAIALIRVYKGEAVELALMMLEPHLLTWSVLGVLNLLVQEVFVVHTFLKENNTYSRPIFDFLLRPEVFPTLEEYQQQFFTADFDTFRSGLALNAALGISVPSPEQGILPDTWLGRSDDEWAYEAWDTMLAALGAGVSPVEEAERLVQLDLQLLHHVDLRRWLARPGVKSRADEVGLALSALLVHLCARGALLVPAVLDTFVYSQWAGPVGCTLFRALVLLADVRVVSPVSGGSSTLLNVGLRTASMCVFDDEYLPELLAGLVHLQAISQASEVPPEHKVEAMVLLDTTIRSPHVLAAFFRILARRRHSHASDGGFDGISFGTDGFDRFADLLLPLVINHDKDEPWAHVLRMFVISAGLQTTEKTGIPYSSLLLDDLVVTALSDKSVAELISEYADTMPLSGMQKIVDVGAHELALRLTQIHEVECDYDKAGDILQLLASMVSSLRSRNMKAPVIAPSAQDELFKAINFAFTSFTDRILLRGGIQPIEDILTERIIFLARVLQFDLGLPEIWTPATCSIAPDLCTRLFHMVVFYARSMFGDSTPFVILMDTLYFLVDEATTGVKTADPFLMYPTTALSGLPADVPRDRLEKIRQLLPLPDPHPIVANIWSQYGSVEAGGPLLNHPWEWSEYLSDATDGEGPLPVRHLIENTAALSLEVFDASGTGERLPTSRSTLEAAALRTFEDSLTSETVFEQAWRSNPSTVVETASLALPNIQTAIAPEAAGWVTSMMASPHSQSHPNSRGTSPASSVQSRASFILPGLVRASPLTGVTSTPQAPGVVPSGARRVNKRKAPQILDSDGDDEVQIVDPPPTASTSTVSTKPKPRPRPVGKAKTQMR